MALLGGELVYIPETAPQGHRLEKLLGRPAYVRLCREYGSETLRIPANAEDDRLGRVRTVASMIRGGHRISEIAKAIDKSPRQVMRYLVEAEQLGLLEMVVMDQA